MQQRRSFPYRTTSFTSGRPPISPKARLIGLEDVQRDVALVMVRDEHRPFVQRQRDLAAAQTASLVQPALDFGSTISVYASIGRIGQHVMHRAECSTCAS